MYEETEFGIPTRNECNEVGGNEKIAHDIYFCCILTLATTERGKKNSGIIWLFTCSLA